MGTRDYGEMILLNNGKEFEDLCRKFSRLINLLGSITDGKYRLIQIDLAETVLETLNRQFEAKIEGK